MKKFTGFVSAGAIALGLLLTGCSHTRKGVATLELFDGKTLDGWNFVLADPNMKMADVWSVEHGILTCKGTPVGAIYKGPAVKNFRLVVEYRWGHDTPPGNSGIFSRIHDPIKPLPPCVEVQLKHGSAGDVLGLQGTRVVGGQPRFFQIKNHPLAGDVAGVNKMFDAEKRAGEWNRVEINALDDVYTVWVNGKRVNEVPGVAQYKGAVGLQSEGGVIQFRRVSLTPMDNADAGFKSLDQ